MVMSFIIVCNEQIGPKPKGTKREQATVALFFVVVSHASSIIYVLYFSISNFHCLTQEMALNATESAEIKTHVYLYEKIHRQIIYCSQKCE